MYYYKETRNNCSIHQKRPAGIEIKDSGGIVIYRFACTNKCADAQIKHLTESDLTHQQAKLI